MSCSRRPVMLLAALLAAALVGGCGGGQEAAEPRASAAGNFMGSYLEPPVNAPDFALHDQDGRLIRLSALRGSYVIVTFLYTNCPDVCPLIAANLNRALRELDPAERRRVRILAVSVDPAGDTPAAVRRFVTSHRLLPEFRYLTGTRKELAPVWRDYNLAVDPHALDEIDHSAYELLVTPEGDGRVLYDTQAKPAAVVHDLRELMRNAPS